MSFRSCPAFFAGALTVAAVLPAVAQTTPEIRFETCAGEIRSHADWMAEPDSTWSFSIDPAAGGSLRYLGARHADDPGDPQFTWIEATWRAERPTRAFFEGPDRGVAATAEESMERFGESGYVRFLAVRDTVPVSTLEPSPLDEAAYLRERFPDDQVALFYLLREASRLRERKGMEGPAIEAAIVDLLARAREMGLLHGEVTNVQALDRAYRRYWKEPAEWWRAPAAWFDPMKSSSETGGIFTNDVNRASSAYRDLHMARLLVEAVASGERVVAVVGRNHVPLQAPAIACSFGLTGPPGG